MAELRHSAALAALPAAAVLLGGLLAGGIRPAGLLAGVLFLGWVLPG